MSKDTSTFVLVLLLAGLTIPTASLAPAVIAAHSRQGNTEKVQKDTSTKAVSANALGPIDPYVVAGGGGRSSGNNFVLEGTIGQPAAGSQVSASTFTLNSGFWNVVSDTVVLKKRRGQTISQ